VSDAIDVRLTEDCRAELRELPKPDRTWINGVIHGLQAKGWQAAMADRTIAPLQDGIWELRIVGHGAAYRILFFVMPGRSPRLVVLTLCLAKSDSQKTRVLKAAVARAARRRELWLEQEVKRNEG
jgi:putative component of toxin-antitoxin plasmid stabilization module